MNSHEQEIAELQARILDYEKGIQADQIVQSIAVNSPSNIMMLDLDARIQYINHTVPGITPEEMVGLKLLDIVEEEFRHGILGALRRVAQSGKPDRYETSYTSPSGDLSWWDSGVGPVIQDSKVTGYVVVSTNVTEQRRRREEQERFFNISADMMCVTDFNGKFKRRNQALNTTLGFEPEDIEQTFLGIVHPKDKSATSEVLSRLREGEIVNGFNNRCLDASGMYRLFSWRAVADQNNQAIYAVARDITDTTALEEQLQKSRKMEAFGQLAGGIAHDFNNLLTAIQGNIELALLKPKSQNAYLNSSMEAISRAASLTHQLLVFSRHKKIDPSPLYLNPFLDSIMTLLERLLPENISITLLNAKNIPPILADKSQLEQIIVNLCVNARDAMPEGGKLTLSVSYINFQGDHFPISSPTLKGDYVELSVTDTGIGMSKDTLQHIFEPFYTTKDIGKGTGLGLATVYGIVKKHNGHIEVESNPEEGTTFRVYLPISTEAPADSKAPQQPSCQDTKGHETILVAEDEEMVRSVATKLLSHAGYTVLPAVDGLDAVRLFSDNANKISLALLDVVMPNQGGLKTAEELRAITSDLPIIFASGHVNNPRDAELLKNENFIPKPYKTDNLLRSIRTTLDSEKK